MRFSFIMAICLIGCGSTGPDLMAPAAKECTVGASISCTCDNGATGAQVCQVDGTYNECSCEVDAATDSITADVLTDNSADVATEPTVSGVCQSTWCCTDDGTTCKCKGKGSIIGDADYTLTVCGNYNCCGRTHTVDLDQSTCQCQNAPTDEQCANWRSGSDMIIQVSNCLF